MHPETPPPAARQKPSVMDSSATAAVEADAEIRAMDDDALLAGIARLRRERDALILAHNYQIPAIPEVDILGTEVGLLHRLNKEAPGHSIVALREDAICEYMKAITLPKLYRALRDDVYELTVEPEIATRARAAIDRMLQVKAR